MGLSGVLRHLRRGGRPDDLLDVVRRLLREERLDDLLVLLAALDEDARAGLRAWWREDASEALRARRGQGGPVPRADALLAAACAEDGTELLGALFPTAPVERGRRWEDLPEVGTEEPPSALADGVRDDVVRLVATRGDALAGSVVAAARTACAATRELGSIRFPTSLAALETFDERLPAGLLPGRGDAAALRLAADIGAATGVPLVLGPAEASVWLSSTWEAALGRPGRRTPGPPGPADGAVLVDALRQVARPAQLLALLLADPAAELFLHSVGRCPGHDLRAAVGTAVEGDDRAWLARAVLDVLDAAPTPRHQQVLADVLAGLTLPASWVLEEADHLLGLLPVLSRSSAVVVAGLLLDADPPPALLAEVGAVVLSRGEKASHRRLVDVLVRRVDAVTATPPGPEGEREVLHELLGAVADGEDLRLARRVAPALARLAGGDEGGPAADDPTSSAAAGSAASAVRWDVPSQSSAPPRPFARAEASPDGLDGLSEPGHDTWLVPRGHFLDEDRWLDAGVRLAAHDPGAFALWAVTSRPVCSPGDRPARALRAWGRASGLVPLPPGEVVDSPPSLPGWSITSSLGADGRWHEERRVLEEFRDGLSGPQVLRAALADEVHRLHLGASPELLSTPSTQDGVVHLEDLAARMRRVPGYGPVDLLVALLRVDLQELPAGAEDRLADLVLPPLTGAPGPLPDGGDVVRRWFADGGLEERRTVLRDGDPEQEPATRPGVLPAQEALLDEVLVGPSTTWYLVPVLLGLLPTWVEAAAVGHGAFGASAAEPFPRLVAGPGRPGLAVHHRVVEMLAHERADCRAVGAQAVLTMAYRDVLDPAVLTSSALVLLDLRQLPLARTAAACETVAVTGGLAPVWPVLVALVDRVADAPRLPAGSADLLRVVRGLAPTALDHLGPAALPASLERLAGRRGSSQAVLEARELARLRRAAGAVGAAG